MKYITEENIKTEATGDIESLYIKEGDYVTKGQVVAKLKNKSMTDAVTNAKLSLSDSQISYENARDKVDDYTIKAPISGTVIEKNLKVGDKLDSSKSATTSMATIYDMSALKCDLAIDETDIGKVEVGQSVSIAADAIEGKTYNGTVTGVSVVGTTNYGITTYPVTVEITEFDDQLLPGMNIEATISISSAQNVIAVPISAVNRGDTVYIKGDKENGDDKAPDGFKTVKVETGVSDGAYIEIKSGVSEGDTVKVITTIATKGSDQENMPAMGMGREARPAAWAEECLQAAACPREAETAAAEECPAVAAV